METGFRRGGDRRLARYQVGGAEGVTGSVSTYGVFDGMQLCTCEFRGSAAGVIRGLRPSQDSLVILHCRLGGMRLACDGGELLELDEGEAAVFRADERALATTLPEGFFQGACLRLSLRALTPSSRHGMSEFGIDLKGLVASMPSGSGSVLRNAIDMHHTFSELYNLLGAETPNLGYLRLKAFELLVLLGGPGPRGGLEDPVGSSLFVGRMQVAYRAQQVMTRRLSEPIGVEALARQCEVSPTVLKEAFRKTFGMPVGTWYRAYRIHRSCDLLRGSDLSIAEVGRAVGYASASKFSRAFVDVEGMTPSAWRRSAGSGGDGAAGTGADDAAGSERGGGPVGSSRGDGPASSISAGEATSPASAGESAGSASIESKEA